MSSNSVIIHCQNDWVSSLNEIPGFLDFNVTLCIPEKSQVISASQNFYSYVTPIILTVGFVGNILSLVVFISRNMRKLSASTYLAALSISDTSALLFYVLVDWLRRGLPYFTGSQEVGYLEIQGLCQVQTYLSYVCRFISAWIIVTFTVERYIGVCHPLQRKHIRGNRSPLKVIVILIAIACICMIYKPILTVRYEFIMKHRTVARCSRDPNLPLVSFILDSIFALSITIIPFILITILNTFIIRRLYIRNQRKIQRHVITEESKIRMEFTIILLVVSFVFVALNLPYFCFWCRRFLQIFESHAPSLKQLDMLDQSEANLQISRVLFYLNYCINFFLYSITGAYFRKELKMLFRYRSSSEFRTALRVSYRSTPSTPQSWV